MKKRLLSALLFTAALSLPAAAQTLPAQPAPEGSGTRPAPRTSAAEIDDANDAASPEEVSKKITRFEKILAALPKFSGYAQIGYTYQTNVGGTDGKNSSSFNVKRMRLILTGDISRTFDYKMQFEGFSSSADQQGKALITVQDMYLRAKIRPQIHIWAGQFPVPLTIENYDISPGTLEVPNFSHAILKMVCRNAVSGYNTYGRDCGLQATGAFLHRDGWDMLTYNLALFNGSQMNRSDDNKSKDIVARLTFFPLRELRISGSVNWGEYTNNTVSKDYIPMTRYAAGFWYDSEHILVRAEYAHTGSSAAYTDKTTGGKDTRQGRRTDVLPHRRLQIQGQIHARNPLRRLQRQTQHLPARLGRQAAGLSGGLPLHAHSAAEGAGRMDAFEILGGGSQERQRLRSGADRILLTPGPIVPAVAGTTSPHAPARTPGRRGTFPRPFGTFLPPLRTISGLRPLSGENYGPAVWSFYLLYIPLLRRPRPAAFPFRLIRPNTEPLRDEGAANLTMQQHAPIHKRTCQEI